MHLSNHCFGVNRVNLGSDLMGSSNNTTEIMAYKIQYIVFSYSLSGQDANLNQNKKNGGIPNGNA